MVFSPIYAIFAPLNLKMMIMRTPFVNLWMFRLVLLLGSYWLLFTASLAQETRPWEQYLNEVMTAEDAGSAAWEQTYELLCELEQHPMDINRVSREQLEELPFLSAQQVEGIMEYLDRYGPIRSLNELKMIPELDYQTCQQLTHYVMIGKERPARVWPRLSDVAKYGKHTFMATAKIPFYERRGDRNGYMGYRMRHDLRYQFNYNNRIKFGITAAQDAGEPFFANRNTMGYDHYSYYFQLRNIGKLEALNLGLYRVQMGMGLIMNTGFHLGKLATLQSMGRNSKLLTAHTSRSVVGYLQGAAATISLSKQFKLTAFASYRPVDATLNEDGTARTKNHVVRVVRELFLPDLNTLGI